MGLKNFIYLLLAVVIIVSAKPKNARATLRFPASVSEPIIAKSFAVFVVSTSTSGQAIGGVAGTAFFTGARDVVTAYHVLQPSSFEIPEGFAHRQVWLIHEGEPAIEIHPDQDLLRYDANTDLTRITLTAKNAVLPKYIYKRSKSGSTSGPVSTEGFRANTAGPTLAPSEFGVKVVEVSHLERINLDGEILLNSLVEMNAPDVKLHGVSCIQTTLGPVRGISGGPLLANGEVIGMNSFADPRGNGRTWAVRLSD